MNKNKKKRVAQSLCAGLLLFLMGIYTGRLLMNEEKKEAMKTADAQVVNLQEAVESLEKEKIEIEKNAERELEEVLEELKELEADVPPVEHLPSDWNLLLVNQTHPLPADFKVELGDIGSGHKIDKRAVEEYKAMELAAKQAGCTVYVVSSYRTMDKQIELHHKKIEEYVDEGYTYADAQEKAATIVAIPGTSEHQLGLAVDMISANYKKLDQKQETTKGFQWLKEHCWEYGFILRYPNGKTDITGIIYEPWHFRYVGKPVAKEITERGITLEEYLGANPVSMALEE